MYHILFLRALDGSQQKHRKETVSAMNAKHFGMERMIKLEWYCDVYSFCSQTQTTLTKMMFLIKSLFAT